MQLCCGGTAARSSIRSNRNKAASAAPARLAGQAAQFDIQPVRRRGGMVVGRTLTGSPRCQMSTFHPRLNPFGLPRLPLLFGDLAFPRTPNERREEGVDRSEAERFACRVENTAMTRTGLQFLEVLCYAM